MEYQDMEQNNLVKYLKYKLKINIMLFQFLHNHTNKIKKHHLFQEKLNQEKTFLLIKKIKIQANHKVKINKIHKFHHNIIKHNQNNAQKNLIIQLN